MSADYAGADVVLVNTCGFLDSAKEESLEAIGEAIAENGRVIVTGCMGDEADVIRAKFPQVLAVTGAHQYEQVVNAVHDASPPVPNAFVDLVPEGGLKLTPRHYSYLKISEGCNHRCSFCIIPSIRGDLVSRRIDAVLREAEKLVAAGTKELLVISQDTSAYGVDTRHEPRQWKGREVRAHMTDLARELGQLRTSEGAAPWVRLHYVYPYPHVDEVIGLRGRDDEVGHVAMAGLKEHFQRERRGRCPVGYCREIRGAALGSGARCLDRVTIRAPSLSQAMSGRGTL